MSGMELRDPTGLPDRLSRGRPSPDFDHQGSAELRGAAQVMNAAYEVRDGYLYSRATGEFTPAKARDLFLECIEMARRHGRTRLVCDITLLTAFDDQIELTMTRFNIAKFVAQSLPSGFKLAVLATPQQIARDRFGENVMVNNGASAKETSNLDEALEWKARRNQALIG